MLRKKIHSIPICIAISLALLGPTVAEAAEDFDPKTKKTIIELMRENPDAIPLEPRDPSRKVEELFRNCHDNPKREYGPINIQKTIGGLAFHGIPTFIRLPVALCPEDLKAGKVDVAIMGAPIDMPTGQRGTGYGPQAVRTNQVAVRILREVLTGMAMRKKGIKDPIYLDKYWADHGVPLKNSRPSSFNDYCHH